MKRRNYKTLYQKFNSLKNTDPREAAEYGFALAVLYQKAGKKTKAVRFGKASIDMLNKYSVFS